MRTRFSLLLSAIFLLLGSSAAHATLANYLFTVGSGSQLPMGTATTLYQGSTGGGIRTGVTGVNLPFTFMFEGVDYSRVSVSVAGVIGLGATDVTTSNANNLTSQNIPIIAPWWDALRLAGNQAGTCGGTARISHATTGSAPNRVFIVQYQFFETVMLGSTPTVSTMQVRLYEGANRIEFWYGTMTSRDNCNNTGLQGNTSASIGLATSSSNFLSITPNGSTASRSSTAANNSIDLASTTITANTVYTFNPCNIEIAGNIAQGGTTSMNSGDQLLGGYTLLPNNAQSYQPFTISNPTTGCASRNYTYTISGPAAADYQISQTGGTIAVGGTNTPTIIFTPSAGGTRNATFVVADDNGFSRSYSLVARGTTSGANFFVDNQPLGPSVRLFNNVASCAGAFASTQQVVIRSTGFDPFVLTNIDFFRIDTTAPQGATSYPLSRDRFGSPIASRDYFISRQPGVAPNVGGQSLRLPDTIMPGQTRTYYITYIGQEPGKRFARAFINSNGTTFTGTTIDGRPADGMLNFDLFGRAIGGRLADSTGTRTLRTMVFPNIRTGDSVDLTYQLFNIGECELHIPLEMLMVTSGDVQDFRLLTAFGRTIVEGAPQSGDAIIAPGSSGSITIRFKPQRNGSRRATLWIQTNDSSMIVPGISERGAYYLDLYGTGKAYLDYSDVRLRTAVIGSGVASRGVIRVVNSSTATVGIQSLTLVGGQAAEFSPDAASGAWPATPFDLIPGAEMKLGVQMLPTGTAGARATTLRLVTTTGETIDISISSEAGSQALTVTPGRLFVGATVTTGEEKRETVFISNTGTLPIRIISTTITGPGQNDYSRGTLPRVVIEPNAVEGLEITYAPRLTGASPATLTIVSDAGTMTVSLEGTGGRTRRDDPTETLAILPGANGGTTLRENVWNAESTSGVREAAVVEMRIEALRPNPARDRAELVYSIARGSWVRVELYDGAGRLVRQIASGARVAGEHRELVDVSTLTAGAYHCRLVVGDVEQSRSLVVVK